MTLHLLNYKYKKKEIYGYLFDFMTKGNLKVYRKISKKFIPESKESFSFDKTFPSRYVDEPTVFFIQIGDGSIVEFPKNKKELMEMFPEKKDLIKKSVNSYQLDSQNINMIINIL